MLPRQLSSTKLSCYYTGRAGVGPCSSARPAMDGAGVCARRVWVRQRKLNPDSADVSPRRLVFRG